MKPHICKAYGNYECSDGTDTFRTYIGFIEAYFGWWRMNVSRIYKEKCGHETR